MSRFVRIGFPTGFDDVLVRTLKVLAMSFLVFAVKEFAETGRADLPAGVLDAVWVAGGTFVLNSILLGAAPRKS